MVAFPGFLAACCGTVVKGAVVKGDGGSSPIVKVEAQGGGTIVEGGVVSVVKAVVGDEVGGKAIKKPHMVVAHQEALYW